jgi:hypothetical protein
MEEGEKVKHTESMTCKTINSFTVAFVYMSMVPGMSFFSQLLENSRFAVTAPPSMTRRLKSSSYTSSYEPGRSQYMGGIFGFLFLQMVVVAVSARELRPPFSTSSRWVVDHLGVRVKLSCVTWAGHLEADIPEGLSKNTAPGIVTLIQANGAMA